MHTGASVSLVQPGTTKVPLCRNALKPQADNDING